MYLGVLNHLRMQQDRLRTQSRCDRGLRVLIIRSERAHCDECKTRSSLSDYILIQTIVHETRILNVITSA